jgi:hypothetical protein
MTTPALLRPLVSVLTWPVARFSGVRRTYELSLPPSDARAVIRGGIGTDPMFMSVGDGLAASRSRDIVGHVDDDGALQVYVSARRVSGLGLVGNVSPLGDGSRVDARVGWTGLHKWVMPGINVLALGTIAWLVVDGFATGGELGTGGTAAYVGFLAVGWLVMSTAVAHNAQRELPEVIERVEKTLAPHLVRPSGS